MSKEAEKQTLFVSNLHFKVSQEKLAELFSEFSVESCRLITFRGRSKGYGFVTLREEHDLNAAIAKLDGTEIEERVIKVQVAIPQKEGERKSKKVTKVFGV
jgi:RNA recognition motif-containing protein